jgi:hypothetical protein
VIQAVEVLLLADLDRDLAEARSHQDDAQRQATRPPIAVLERMDANDRRVKPDRDVERALVSFASSAFWRRDDTIRIPSPPKNRRTAVLQATPNATAPFSADPKLSLYPNPVSPAPRTPAVAPPPRAQTLGGHLG